MALNIVDILHSSGALQTTIVSQVGGSASTVASFDDVTFTQAIKGLGQPGVVWPSLIVQGHSIM